MYPKGGVGGGRRQPPPPFGGRPKAAPKFCIFVVLLLYLKCMFAFVLYIICIIFVFYAYLLAGPSLAVIFFFIFVVAWAISTNSRSTAKRPIYLYIYWGAELSPFPPEIEMCAGYQVCPSRFCNCFSLGPRVFLFFFVVFR